MFFRSDPRARSTSSFVIGDDPAAASTVLRSSATASSTFWSWRTSALSITKPGSCSAMK